MKRQQIRPMKAKWDEQKANLDEFVARPRAPGEQKVFRFDADLKSLDPQFIALTSIQKLIFDEISSSNAVLGFLGLLQQSTDKLSSSLRQRNDFIDKINSGPRLESSELATLYFGIPHEGHRDQRYADLVAAISDYCDECIVLSLALLEELERQGLALRGVIGKSAPNLNRHAKDDLIRNNIIPDSEEFRALIARARGNEVAANEAVRRIYRNK